MTELYPIRAVPPIARDMNLDRNRLPSTQSLAGQTIKLAFDDGAAATLRLAAGWLACEVADEGETGKGQVGYDAVELRPGIFFPSLRLVRSWVRTFTCARPRAGSLRHRLGQG